MASRGRKAAGLVITPAAHGYVEVFEIDQEGDGTLVHTLLGNFTMGNQPLVPQVLVRDTIHATQHEKDDIREYGLRLIHGELLRTAAIFANAATAIALARRPFASVRNATVQSIQPMQAVVVLELAASDPEAAREAIAGLTKANATLLLDDPLAAEAVRSYVVKHVETFAIQPSPAAAPTGDNPVEGEG